MSLELQRPAAAGERARVLGGSRLGGGPDGGPDRGPAWPCQRLPAALSGAATVDEVWLAAGPCVAGDSEGIAWRRSGGLLFGVIELDETDFAAAADAYPLQQAATEAYARIFRLLAAQRLPYLWRLWNYCADINGEEAGLERYRQFNIGRQEAFRQHGRSTEGQVPAACALGLAAGPVSVAFLAADVPAVAIENPRQVSAYAYPAEYGPRSPTFSRAVLAYPDGQEMLFISGTASIVGHATRHVGDVRAQCRETLANLAAVVDEANRRRRGDAFTLAELDCRVYLRDAADRAAVHALLAACIDHPERIVYLQADVCRGDLLLEIEASAGHALPAGSGAAR